MAHATLEVAEHQVSVRCVEREMTQRLHYPRLPRGAIVPAGIRVELHKVVDERLNQHFSSGAVQNPDFWFVHSHEDSSRAGRIPSFNDFQRRVYSSEVVPEMSIFPVRVLLLEPLANHRLSAARAGGIPAFGNVTKASFREWIVKFSPRKESLAAMIMAGCI